MFYLVKETRNEISIYGKKGFSNMEMTHGIFRLIIIQANPVIDYEVHKMEGFQKSHYYFIISPNI